MDARPLARRLLLHRWKDLRSPVVLADVTTSRLNGAVQLCLQRCYRAENPVACLAEYAAELHRMGWQEREVEEFEIAVRRILGRVLRPATAQRTGRESASCRG